MNKKVRVRFAPSPTGYLHIGSLRVAIFNWLFARHNGGKYLLRIEDTDLERSKKEYRDSILRALSWCGLSHDEDVVIQSQRADQHKKFVEQLLQNGKAYKCYCSPEEIAQRQKQKGEHNDLFSMYDGHCLSRESSSPDKSHSSGSGQAFVVRFKVPREEKTITFTDLIRGPISFDVDQFDDFIISRSDGSPVYNLVVVVDDAQMGVSHVIRGEDHISNTPKQIMLYKACGLSVPEFAHLPLILGPSGDKLSKRDAATNVLDYQANGYLPEALVNYLVRLGWSHGDQEIFSKEEMIEFFSLDQVGKAGAIFDSVKLDWLNGMYIRQLDAKSLLQRMQDDVDANILTELSSWTEQQVLDLIDLYKDRVKTLGQLKEQLVLLYNGCAEYDKAAMEKWIKPETKQFLQKLFDLLETIEPFQKENLSSAVKALCSELNIKLVALAQPIRIALTGTSASPGVFALLELVGRQESIDRVTKLIKQLN